MSVLHENVSIETKENMVDETLESLGNWSQNSKKSGTSDKIVARSELSLDVNDILDLELDEPVLETKLPKNSLQSEKIKCCPVVVGGANMSLGYSQPANPRICSALHCRDCDLSVSAFPDQEWIERVDYLFLRTNMPNFEKVSKKLRRKSGTIAYACHCVSFSTEKLQQLHEVGLPWFCKGHA